MLKGEGALILARPFLRGEHFLDRPLQSFIRRRLREEAVPIHGIELKLRGVKFSRIHCEPDGIALVPRQEGNVTIIAVPPVAVHSAVMLEDAVRP